MNHSYSVESSEGVVAYNQYSCVCRIGTFAFECVADIQVVKHRIAEFSPRFAFGAFEYAVQLILADGAFKPLD